MKNILKNLFIAIKEVSKINKFYLLYVIICAICTSLFVYEIPCLLKILIDCLDNKLTIIDLLLKCGAVGLFFTIMTIIFRITTNKANFIEEQYGYVSKHELSKKTLLIDYEILEQKEVQEEYEKARNCCGRFGSFVKIIGVWKNFIIALIQLIISITIIILLDYRILLIVFSCWIVRIIFNYFYTKIIKKYSYDLRMPINRKINYCNNLLRIPNIGKDLRVFSLDEIINNNKNNLYKELIELKEKENKRNLFFNFLFYILDFLSKFGIYFLIILFYYNNQISIGSYTFLIGSTLTIIKSLNKLSDVFSNILNSNYRINDYLNFIDKTKIVNSNKLISDNNFTIELQNVSFKYMHSDNYVLQNVSF